MVNPVSTANHVDIKNPNAGTNADKSGNRQTTRTFESSRVLNSFPALTAEQWDQWTFKLRGF